MRRTAAAKFPLSASKRHDVASVIDLIVPRKFDEMARQKKTKKKNKNFFIGTIL